MFWACVGLPGLPAGIVGSPVRSRFRTDRRWVNLALALFYALNSARTETKLQSHSFSATIPTVMLSSFHAIGHAVARYYQPQRHSGYEWLFWLEKMQHSLNQSSASGRLPQLDKINIVPGIIHDNRALQCLVLFAPDIVLLTGA